MAPEDKARLCFSLGLQTQEHHLGDKLSLPKVLVHLRF